MRHPILITLCVAGALGLQGCGRNNGAETAKALKDINVIEESNLSELMLTTADPQEAVDYFAKTAAQNPQKVALKRGLAKSLIRANKPLEAANVWREVAYGPEGTNEDHVSLADALIRNNDWKAAEKELGQVPPTHETFERYRLEAMVADANKRWKKADSYYETAFGLTTTPAGVLNNWGYSKLTRGDYKGAEKLFGQSLTYDPTSFTAKNNLVLARASQGRYDMPIVQMTQSEKAQLLYTAALVAIKAGNISMGKTLLQDAIDTNPQYFEAAVRALETLDANVTRG
ncbi:MAG: tetratricopeptide repeat protein [Rhodobacteraceae bacterium]|nr:tetratricopeptide repeat protein [Paracoccaceae bacterium]